MICGTNKLNTENSLVLAAILAFPFTIIAILAAVEYKKLGIKEPILLSKSLFGAHPYLATVSIILANILLLIACIAR